ncbi:hypothetical protein [Metaplanococcus flavidus]|uniref:Uncharacterized protein n=1 Tax=Metaplanococcus flavidus TaxID=569883 RepID=A0ABW3LB79_9BACL
MNENTNWWEPVFSGQLEIGLNKEKLEDIEEETFLYYSEANQEMEPRL